MRQKQNKNVGNVKAESPSDSQNEEKIHDPFKGPYLHQVIEEYPILEKLGDWEIFKPLAWSGRIRSLLYNKEKNILVREVEGDLYIWKNPTDEKIEEEIQEYPKSEVTGLGEKLDSRFER